MSSEIKNEIGNEDDEKNDAPISVKQQSAQLFAALEHGAVSSPDGILSTQPFVSLMAKGNDRNALLDMIRSPKFQIPHARRLFGAILPIVEHVVENESYIPLSAFDDEEGDNSSMIIDSDFQQDQERGTSQDNRKRRSTEDCATSSDETDVITPDEASTRALLFLKYVAMMVRAYLDNLIQRRPVRTACSQRVFPIADDVWKVADLLHDVLFSLHSCGVEGTAVQTTISSMCEHYWKGQFADREALTTQLIPLLVVKTLNGNATKADLKRLWDMRLALTLLDFKEESGIVHLKTLLLRTVSCPFYLKQREGWRLVSFLFQLDSGLVRELHEAIRVQIPLAKRRVLEAYGNIYWSAWKDSSTATKQDMHDSQVEEDASKSNIQIAIEENALQDLMYAVLHVSSPHMARSLRILLEPLHKQKKSPQVDQLLYRMYGPLLWRALSATNPLVRIHASSILPEVFPLHDPLAGKIHLRAVTEKSVETLIGLLNDYDPKVRVAGCNAAVRILGMYWDALSSQDIRSLLNEIIMNHANDTSSAAVRAQAINGISLLLDAEQSHAVLRPLLPLLGNLIHDSVERVRLATVKLLLKLKGMKGIKFYHVVPSHHLLARLAAEGEGARNQTGSIALALTGLLCNSYFPKGMKGSEQMRRTIHFLSDNPKAARVFYSNLANHLEVNNICKLIAMLIQTVQLEISQETKRGKRSKKRRRGKVPNELQDDRNCVTHTNTCNTTLIAEVTETIVCLWNSVESDLLQSENEPCLQFLMDKIGGDTLTKFFSYFDKKIDSELVSENYTNVKRQSEYHRICGSILSCAGMMSPDTTSGLSTVLTSHMNDYCKATRKNQERESLSPVIALFCSWGLYQDVATSFYNSIVSEFGDDNEVEGNLLCDEDYVGILGGSERRSKRKQSNIQNLDKVPSAIPQLPAISTLKLIGNILSGTDSYSITARDTLLSSETACSIIENALEKGTVVAEKILTKSTIKSDSTSDQIEMVLSACEAYGRLALHKAANKNGPLTLNSQISTLLTWITVRVFPALITAKDLEKTPNLFDDINLSRISSESPSTLSPLAVPPPRRRSNLNITPTKLDSSFLSMEKHGVERLSWGRGASSVLHRQAMGLALVKSALFTISEWLLIGGQGSKEISQYALKWCKEIVTLDFKNFDCALELFPAFTRLALVLGRCCLDYELFKEILFMANDISTSGDKILEVLKSALTSIVSLRGALSMEHAEKLAHVVIDLSENIVANNDYGELGSDAEKEIDSLDYFIPADLRCLTLTVRIMMSNGASTVALAKVISKRSSVEKSNVVKYGSFLNELFLQFLRQQVPRGKYFDQMKEITYGHSRDHSSTRIQTP